MIAAAVAASLVAATVLAIGCSVDAAGRSRVRTRVAPPRPRERRDAGLALPFAARRAATRRRRQLPHALESVAAALRGGASLRAALATASPGLDEPLRSELTSIAQRAAQGEPLVDGFDAWAEGAADDDVRIAATALVVGASTGGAVARVVDGAAATLRDRAALAAEVRALATQARASAAVLAVVPPGFTLLAGSLEPRAAHFLLHTPSGLACLAAGVVLDALGIAWMAHIVRRVS